MDSRKMYLPLLPQVQKDSRANHKQQLFLSLVHRMKAGEAYCLLSGGKFMVHTSALNQTD